MSDENNNNTDNADLLDDWEDEGLENVGVQDEASSPPPAQPPSVEQQAQSPEDLIDLPPVKKKKGGGFLIFLLLLLVGGGGYYYLTTPAGEPYRDYLPEAVRDFLPPAGDAQQQATASQPRDDTGQAQDTAESGFDVNGYTTADVSGDDTGFGAPPMPTAVYEEDRETVESGADAWSPLPFGEASEEEDQSFELAWGSSEEESFSAEEAVENGEPQVAETQEEDAIWEMGLWGEINETQDGVEESATDYFSASEEFPVEAVTADSLYEDKTADEKSDRKDEAADAESFDVDPFSFVPLGVEEKAETAAAADAGREETGVISEKAETRTEKEPEKKITAKEETVKQTAEKDTQEKLEVKEVQQLRAEPPRTETSRAEPVRAEVKREWRLDAASPGAALLSEKNTRERREVVVGDTIPGLGRITSIAPDDESGRWVVRGTQGSVYQ